MTRGRVRALWQALILVVHADPWRATVVLVAVGLTSVSGGLLALALKWIVDAATRGNVAEALWAGSLGAAAKAAMSVLGRVQQYYRHALSAKVALSIDRRILQLTAGLPGLEHLERPEYLDRVQLVMGRGHDIAAATWAITDSLSLLFRLAVSIGLLASLDPWLGLVALSAAPAFLALSRKQALIRRSEEQVAQLDRKQAELHEFFLDAGPAKELRAHGCAAEIDRLASRLWDRAANRRLWANVTAELLGAVAWSVFTAGVGIALLVVAGRALRGQGSPGDVVEVFTLAIQLGGQLGGVVATLQSVSTAFRTMDRFVWLDDYARATRARDAEPKRPVPNTLSTGVRLDHVWFRYPGTRRHVLRDICFELPAGGTVAIVGDNGSGKTTLAKLLCRMYSCQRGRITVDGTNILSFEAAAWRRSVSAAFQDFTRFELPLVGSVGVGDLARVDDERAVEHALYRAAAADLADRWPAGLQAALGRTYRAGVDPSLGEWQKVAVARAMMRQPLLMIIDEPTAHHDSISEAELFHHYAAETEARQRSGGVTVLITHRFWTVALTDHILVLDRGRLVEQGDHDHLMSLDGKYAAMFRAEAAAYGELTGVAVPTNGQHPHHHRHPHGHPAHRHHAHAH